MKFLLALMFLFILTACHRSDIQREEAPGKDDLRESDTYERTIPVPEDEDVQEERDTLQMGTARPVNH